MKKNKKSNNNTLSRLLNIFFNILVFYFLLFMRRIKLFLFISFFKHNIISILDNISLKRISKRRFEMQVKPYLKSRILSKIGLRIIISL